MIWQNMTQTVQSVLCMLFLELQCSPAQVIGVDISPLMAPPDQLENMDLQVRCPMLSDRRCSLMARIGPRYGTPLSPFSHTLLPEMQPKRTALLIDLLTSC